MRAILVDDERLALKLLEIMLERDTDGVEIVGTYSDPNRAIEEVAELQPDLAFLDIRMPGMNGLELGELLKSIVPRLEVVFVTAHAQYAIRAFKVQALDYIMKPVQKQRLQQTVERVRMRMGRDARELQMSDSVSKYRL